MTTIITSLVITIGVVVLVGGIVSWVMAEVDERRWRRQIGERSSGTVHRCRFCGGEGLIERSVGTVPCRPCKGTGRASDVYKRQPSTFSVRTPSCRAPSKVRSSPPRR